MKLYAKKEIVRKYYKYVDTPWTQPVITQNGTLGGDSFAVTATSTGTLYYPDAWRCFDNDTTTYYQANGQCTMIIYNPKEIKVSQFDLYEALAWKSTSAIVQGSNDNINWSDITNVLTGYSTTYGSICDYKTVLTLTNDNSYKF